MQQAICAESMPAPDQRRLALVIDDSPTARKIVEVTLSREGYEVMGFPDGVEALRWLIGPEARLPYLILLDIEMPRMNGYMVALYLKKMQALATSKVVIISRRCGVIERIKARLVGTSVYLTRPFTTQELLAAADVPAYVATEDYERLYQQAQVEIHDDSFFGQWHFVITWAKTPGVSSPASLPLNEAVTL